jgi:hypothetical protein
LQEFDSGFTGHGGGRLADPDDAASHCAFLRFPWKQPHQLALRYITRALKTASVLRHVHRVPFVPDFTFIGIHQQNQRKP